MICSRCGEPHPLSHFRKGPDLGMHDICVTCRRKEAEENGLMCTVCFKVKPLEANFFKHPSLFGYKTICKSCQKKPTIKRKDRRIPDCVVYGIGSWNLITRRPIVE